MFLRALRMLVAAICVAGIAGMIVGSIADNNNGAVITCGLLTAASMVALMAATAALRHEGAEPLPDAIVIDEDLAARVETRVNDLAAAGANEALLRALVRDSVRLGRTSVRMAARAAQAAAGAEHPQAGRPGEGSAAPASGQADI